MSKRILWVGDACVASGFANCTHVACDALHDAGYEVTVLGLNYFGDPHKYPYDVYPCFQPLDGGRDYFGVTRLANMVTRVGPDLVVFLNDPWNIDAYVKALDQLSTDLIPTTMGWLAVDAENQDVDAVKDLDHIVVWTEFARSQLAASGVPISVVPLGVDLEIFTTSMSKVEARSRVCPPDVDHEAFIFGFVGRNQPRKRIDLLLRYFKEFLLLHGDALLYLHVGPTGDKGFSIPRLVKYYGLKGKVILAQPPLGQGVPEEHLAATYRAMDVFVTTTQGEGWCLPVLEAMACGVPCIVPDWSGLGSWVGKAAELIPCHDVAVSAPLNSLAYTIGGVPDQGEFVSSMVWLHDSAAARFDLSHKGLELAQKLPRSLTGSMMVDEVSSLIGPP